MPHLRRAVETYHEVRRLEEERRLFAAALDRSRMGLILVSTSGRVVAKNVVADRILARRDGLLLEGDGLHASCPETTERLRCALAQVSRGKAAGDASVTIVSLPRRSGRRPLAALAAGIPTQGAECGESRLEDVVVSLYVCDADEEPGVSAELVRSVFGLTPAETALACELAGGRSVEEAAEGLGISNETARTRLKHVFLKTETHRQAELMRVLLATPAPLSTE